MLSGLHKQLNVQYVSPLVFGCGVGPSDMTVRYVRLVEFNARICCDRAHAVGARATA